MKNHNHTLLLTILICLVVQTANAQSPVKLWFDKPATYFEESLVLGNGKMGASVFGGPESDKIYLNDATLWSGEPVDPNMNPDAYKSIPQIREALAAISRENLPSPMLRLVTSSSILNIRVKSRIITENWISARPFQPQHTRLTV